MKKLAGIGVIVGLLLIGGLFYFLFGNYSEGYRAGIMIKFSKKGTVFKTYEGELNLGMVLNQEDVSAAMANIWKFSVPGSEKEVIKQLEDAVLSGKRVKLHYKEKFVTLPWRGETKYMVDEAELH